MKQHMAEIKAKSKKCVFVIIWNPFRKYSLVYGRFICIVCVQIHFIMFTCWSNKCYCNGALHVFLDTVNVYTTRKCIKCIVCIWAKCSDSQPIVWTLVYSTRLAWSTKHVVTWNFIIAIYGSLMHWCHYSQRFCCAKFAAIQYYGSGLLYCAIFTHFKCTMMFWKMWPNFTFW